MPLPTQQLRDYFSTQPVIRAWLFGSYADGTAMEDSDVDILGTLDHSRPIRLHYLQMIFDLEDLLGKKVDLVADEGLSKYIRPYVESKKN